MKPLSDCRLYTFVDSAYLHGRSPSEIAKQLCDGGSDIIQLRAKDWSENAIRKAAEAVAKITNEFGVHFVINDYPEIANEVGAPLCHLGQEDFFDSGLSHVSELSAKYHSLKFGLSTHAPGQAERAVKAEPAYIAIGPVYQTGTKPTATPVTLDYVRWARENVTIPWFTIGGINQENLREVIDAGAARVCVVSAILNASDISQACSDLLKLLPDSV